MTSQLSWGTSEDGSVIAKSQEQEPRRFAIARRNASWRARPSRVGSTVAWATATARSTARIERSGGRIRAGPSARVAPVEPSCDAAQPLALGHAHGPADRGDPGTRGRHADKVALASGGRALGAQKLYVRVDAEGLAFCRQPTFTPRRIAGRAGAAGSVTHWLPHSVCPIAHVVGAPAGLDGMAGLVGSRPVTGLGRYPNRRGTPSADTRPLSVNEASVDPKTKETGESTSPPPSCRAAARLRNRSR